MKVVALISGGKDSCYSMQLCKSHGHDIVALANLLPEETAPDELDSFCFQTVGHQLVGAYAACMGIPLFRKHISGTSSVQDLGYTPTDGDEVEDLFQLLAYVKESIPGVQAVATGAIASDYQRLRVENVCSRLNLVSLAYLWHQPQRVLLRGMVESGLDAILVKVACLGLHPRKHLGRSIAALEPHLLALADAYGCNVCGEGGEYETLTLDCSVFTRGRIELDEHEVVVGTCDVGHLVPKAFRVVPKPSWEGGELPADVRLVPNDYVAPSHRHAKSVAPAPAAASAASGAGSGAAAAPAVTCAATAAAGDVLLMQSEPTFDVQASMCTGPDYVQLACRALRPKSALATDVTECDTTAALNALLVAAEQELSALHMDLHHCLFVHLFLANMGHFQAANGVYCKHFTGRDPPSRACVQVCLPHDCPVMCEFLLARGAAPLLASQPPQTAPAPVPRHARRVLHVQSISSWAPSCIGPYSQATSYRGLVYMAGVIPLDPPTMTLVPGDITAQVLRAMASCEAVAVAQRTTVTGAALGLTVYLAASTGGASCGTCGERGCGSGGGAELRALARSAVEALLEHGMPGYAQQSPLPPHRQSGGLAAAGANRAHFRRSSTTDSAGGVSTPRASAAHTLLSGGGVSAPGSRRAVMLGADGLDEEEEEAEQAAAIAAGAGPFSAGRASSSVLEPYLQPPEVRCSARPSVLYVTVPSLPRGSLVEVQPVCLDVEALAVIRKLTGHDSFVKRRTASHHDAASLQQAQSQAQGHGGHTLPTHQSASPLPDLPCSGSSPGGSLGLGVGVGVTTWSELPHTPRASLESNASREGTSSSSCASGPTHGSAPVPWQVSGEGVIAPPPVHMLSASGFMTPEPGSLVGTPSASAGPSMLCRRRSSQPGANQSGAGPGVGGISRSSLLSGQHLHQQPPMSAHASGHQLISPAVQALLQQDQQDQHYHPHAVTQDSHSPAAAPVPVPRPRGSSCGGGGASSGSGGTAREGLITTVAATAPGIASSAPRMSLSGSGGSSGNSGALAPIMQRSSLDGNILSFEVSSGRGSSLQGLLAAPPAVQPFIPPITSPLMAAYASQPGPGASASFGCGSGQAARHRPAAITVPTPSGAASLLQASPFDVGSNSTAASVLAALSSGGAAPVVLAPGSPAATLGVATCRRDRSRSVAGSPLFGGSPCAPTEAPAPPAAPQNGGGGRSSDVMVTTVCCYGQVLRSIFHLPAGVFTPGVTTAQLTRRFRRAATSVLAAHGMDMSCLIWARVWYEKGAVTFTDDEFGYGYSVQVPPLTPSAGGAGHGVSSQGGAARVQHAHSADDEVGVVGNAGDGDQRAAMGPPGDCASPLPRVSGESGGPSAPPGSPNTYKRSAARQPPLSPALAANGRCAFGSPAGALAAAAAAGQPQHFHVSWVPVQRVATNASPQPATPCVAVLELLAALPTP